MQKLKEYDDLKEPNKPFTYFEKGEFKELVKKAEIYKNDGQEEGQNGGDKGYFIDYSQHKNNKEVFKPKGRRRRRKNTIVSPRGEPLTNLTPRSGNQGGATPASSSGDSFTGSEQVDSDDEETCKKPDCERHPRLPAYFHSHIQNKWTDWRTRQWMRVLINLDLDVGENHHQNQVSSHKSPLQKKVEEQRRRKTLNSKLEVFNKRNHSIVQQTSGFDYLVKKQIQTKRGSVCMFGQTNGAFYCDKHQNALVSNNYMKLLQEREKQLHRQRAQTTLNIKEKLESRQKSPYNVLMRQDLDEEGQVEANQASGWLGAGKNMLPGSAPRQPPQKANFDYLDKNLKQALKTRQMVKDFSDSAAEDYGTNKKYFTPKTRKLQHKRDRDSEMNMAGAEDYNAKCATQAVSVDPKNHSPDEQEAVAIKKSRQAQKHTNTTDNTEGTLRDHSKTLDYQAQDNSIRTKNESSKISGFDVSRDTMANSASRTPTLPNQGETCGQGPQTEQNDLVIVPTPVVSDIEERSKSPFVSEMVSMLEDVPEQVHQARVENMREDMQRQSEIHKIEQGTSNRNSLIRADAEASSPQKDQQVLFAGGNPNSPKSNTIEQLSQADRDLLEMQQNQIASGYFKELGNNESQDNVILAESKGKKLPPKKITKIPNKSEAKKLEETRIYSQAHSIEYDSMKMQQNKTRNMKCVSIQDNYKKRIIEQHSLQERSKSRQKSTIEKPGTAMYNKSSVENTISTRPMTQERKRVQQANVKLSKNFVLSNQDTAKDTKVGQDHYMPSLGSQGFNTVNMQQYETEVDSKYQKKYEKINAKKFSNRITFNRLTTAPHVSHGIRAYSLQKIRRNMMIPKDKNMSKTQNQKWNDIIVGSGAPQPYSKKSVQFGEERTEEGQQAQITLADSPDYGIGSRPEDSPSQSDRFNESHLPHLKSRFKVDRIQTYDLSNTAITGPATMANSRSRMSEPNTGTLKTPKKKRDNMRQYVEQYMTHKQDAQNQSPIDQPTKKIGSNTEAKIETQLSAMSHYSQLSAT